MIFLREKWNWIYQKLQQSYVDYRVTMTIAGFITFYAIAGLLWDDLNMKYASRVTDVLFHEWGMMTFLIFFMFVSMLTESLFPYGEKDKNVKIARIAVFLSGVVITCVIVLGMRQNETEKIFNVTGDIVCEWCRRFAVGYVLLLILGIIYVCHRKSGLGFIEYTLQVVANFAVVTAIYFVLLIGISLVILIINLLFLGGYSSLGNYGIILVTGIYYVPACIMAMRVMRYMGQESSDRINGILVKYILSVLTVCALAVVYLYLIKILILWEMPSNKIFGIVAGLFWFGMPVWIMDYYYRDDTKYMTFLQRLPYGLIPLIPVQAYAIGVRIYHNGMTPGRYVGALMILFEIIMLFVWYFWKEKLERVLLIIGTGIVIAVFLPGVNMYSMSGRWQYTFLKSYYEQVMSQGRLTREEYERLKGAYYYLKWEPTMKAAAEQYDLQNADFVAKLAETGAEADPLTQTEYHRIHCCQMVDTLDINDYSHFDMLNQDEGYDSAGDDQLFVDFSAFKFYPRGSEGDEAGIVVDLSDFAERCTAYEEEHKDVRKEEFSSVMKPYNRIVLDNDRVLYLNHFEVSYRDGIKEGKEYFEVTSVNISGILFSR